MSSSLTSLESATVLYSGPEKHEYVTFGGGSAGKAVQRHACGYCGHKTTKYCKTCYEKRGGARLASVAVSRGVIASIGMRISKKSSTGRGCGTQPTKASTLKRVRKLFSEFKHAA